MVKRVDGVPEKKNALTLSFSLPRLVPAPKPHRPEVYAPDWLGCGLSSRPAWSAQLPDLREVRVIVFKEIKVTHR